MAGPHAAGRGPQIMPTLSNNVSFTDIWNVKLENVADLLKNYTKKREYENIKKKQLKEGKERF